MKTIYQISRMLTTFRLAILLCFVFACSPGWAQTIASWQFGTPATIGDEEVAPATTYNPHLFQPVITRGNGIVAHNLARGFSSINWMLSGTDNVDNALRNGNYYEISISAEPHYAISLSNIKARLRRSENGPSKFQWAYSKNNSTFVPLNLGSIGILDNAVEEGELVTFNLATASVMQNIEASKYPFVLRLCVWYALEETGTFAFGRTPEGTSTNSLEINGTVAKSTTLIIGDISTQNIDNVKATSANAYCSIVDIGNPTATHYGVCWGTTLNPTYTDNSKVDFGKALTTNDFIATMDNLTPGTTYYARAYIVNTEGVCYGTNKTFTTLPASSMANKNIAISFTGSGDATTVESVLIENITTGLSKTINGDAVLYLNPTGVGSPTTSTINSEAGQVSKMQIYPNPAVTSSALSFGLSEAGNVIVSINDISGKIVSNYVNTLTAGTYKFQLPALQSGIYFVTLVQNGKKQTEKLVSINNASSFTNLIQQVDKIDLVETNTPPQKVKDATAAVVGMAYMEGNQLRITATSGRCKTIIMDYPNKSKTIDVFFKECIDGDNNAYPIVKVGALYWMAENLKTTKSATGTALNKVTGLAWQQLVTLSDAYCFYGDNDANCEKYGGLYTYNLANRNLMASGGWRLPEKNECMQMAAYLEGKDRAGSKLKEAGPSNWSAENRFSTNESGFTALPGGYNRYSYFMGLGREAIFWTATKENPYRGFALQVGKDNDSIAMELHTLETALSVRYVFEVPDPNPKLMELTFGEKPTENVVETNGLPLPDNTVLMAPDKELFFSGRHDTNLSPQLRFMDNPAATSAPYIAGLPDIATGAVKWWENPKKTTTMVNGNGRESTVIAVWNEAEAGAVSGYKNITMHIIGDASVNFEHKSIVLPDKFWMPEITTSNSSYNGIYMFDSDAQEAWQWEMTVRTGDVTGDGIPDFLVAVHDTLRIYEFNGTTFTKKYERGFNSDFTDLHKSYAFFLRVEVADMDQNGKNDVVVLASTTRSFVNTSTDDSMSAYLHVFLDGDINQTDVIAHKRRRLGNGFNPAFTQKNYARTANMTIGNIDNDITPEIVINYALSGGTSKLRTLVYAKFDRNNKGVDPFIFAGVQRDVPCTDWSVPEPIVLAKLKGHDGPNYIINGSQIYFVNESGILTPNSVNNDGVQNGNFFYITKAYISEHIVYGDQIVAGNFDKNASGIESLYYIVNIRNSSTYTASSTLKMYSSSLDQTTNEVILNTTAVPFFNENSGNLLTKKHFPVIAAVNTKHTGRLLQFVRHQYMFSNPVLIAALAAPPYLEGFYNPNYDISTTWKKSDSAGTGTAKESTHTASLIAGYEHEFNCPILDIKIGGVELTTKASYGFSKNYETSRKTTISVEYSGYKEDMAVVSSTPYDVFFYKILKSENPDEINTELMFGFPRSSSTQVVTVDTYNKLVEGKNAPKIDKSIFRHTLGDPFSYPTTAGNTNLIKLSNLSWGNNLEYETDYVSVGQGGTTRKIGVEKTSTESQGFNMEFDVELVVSLGDFKMGGGYGYTKNSKISTTIGTCTEVEGKVAGLTDLSKSYQWALKWYNFQKSGYKFQVVNYLVKK